MDLGLIDTYKLIDKRRSNKKIWLIYDRLDIARDNAEALFEYIQSNKIKYPNIEAIFVLLKSSEDYERLSKIGKVVDYGSEDHFHLNLIADKIITSHADFIPFKSRVAEFKRWNNQDFVFLQHGVINDDLSDWLNRHNKNLSLFFTSARKEYESIINGNYLYSEKEVKLLGMPRFDKFENNPRKVVTIFPTWRKKLLKGYDKETGKWIASNEDFINSDFYKYYTELVNSEKLKSIIDKEEVEIELILHPNFSSYRKMFINNFAGVKVREDEVNYTEMLNQTSCLI